MCECVMTVYSNPKSPYEIRICDWISYLCAADLVGEPCGPPHEQAGGVDLCLHVGEHEADRLVHDDRLAEGLALLGVLQRVLVGSPGDAHGHGGHGRARSEEHTSELQSLMRISYAVFCLKKTQKEMHKHAR